MKAAIIFLRRPSAALTRYAASSMIRSAARDGMPTPAEARSAGAGVGSPSRSGATNGIVRRRTIAIAAGLLVLACGDVTRTDSRFATPERTVATLLAAHGIGEATADELQGRLIAEGGFAIVDRAAYEACFVDLEQPGGAGMAGYVLGMLAAARGELRYETIEHHGYVQVREGIRIVMRRGEDGAYRIVLAESVPEDIRRSITGIEGASPIDEPRGR
jgi:hypothetical protein